MVLHVPLLTQLLGQLEVLLLLSHPLPSPTPISTTTSYEPILHASVCRPHSHASLACGCVHTLGQCPIPPLPLCDL